LTVLRESGSRFWNRDKSRPIDSEDESEVDDEYDQPGLSKATALESWSDDLQPLCRAPQRVSNGKRAATGTTEAAKLRERARLWTVLGGTTFRAPALRRAPEHEMKSVLLYFRMDSLLRKLRGSYRLGQGLWRIWQAQTVFGSNRVVRPDCTKTTALRIELDRI